MSDFVHRPYQKGETVAAITTPPGDGGVAIIRISGKDAITIADKIFSLPVNEIPSHTLKFGKILDTQKRVVDEVLLTIMRAPRSFTGEDTVEIHCHGGRLITKKVLYATLQAGARAALPGEFSFKAFMNDKIDLTQAEAIQEMIGAKSDTALQLAKQQLEGALSKEIRAFQKELIEIAAILEAWVDFPEEGIEYATKEELIQRIDSILKKMKTLEQTYSDGKLASLGISLCLIGPPNVGKSSLMNALLRKDRAIVTSIAGTTRDLLEEEMCFGDLHFRLIDTAGIRSSTEEIEQEGIRRSKQAMQNADLILLVLDATMSLDTETKNLIASLPKNNTMVAWNKIDLPIDDLPSLIMPSVKVSAKTLEGLDTLKQALIEKVWKTGPPAKDEILICSYRHQQALVAATLSLELVKKGLEEEISPEFLSADMRQTLHELGTIIGINITEDILSSIFSKFCIGK